jgi:hypothetical protein
MNPRLTHAFVGVASALLAATGALAAPPSEAQARYQAERAACDGAHAYQDRATCLREAGAAYEEAKRGRLADGSAQSQYQQNALMRCNGLPPDERSACQARMQGQGTTSGSVAGGGIHRELVIRE